MLKFLGILVVASFGVFFALKSDTSVGMKAVMMLIPLAAVGLGVWELLASS